MNSLQTVSITHRRQYTGIREIKAEHITVFSDYMKNRDFFPAQHPLLCIDICNIA